MTDVLKLEKGSTIFIAHQKKIIYKKDILQSTGFSYGKVDIGDMGAICSRFKQKEFLILLKLESLFCPK